MAACQPSNQPPQRIRRSRAHTFRISQIPIAECAAFSAPHPPRVLSLAAFGLPALVYVSSLSLAGIRNPQQTQTWVFANREVRSSPDSDRTADIAALRICATSGLMHRNKVLFDPAIGKR